MIPPRDSTLPPGKAIESRGLGADTYPAAIRPGGGIKPFELISLRVQRFLGFELGRSTIARVVVQHGIEPAPRRGKAMSWKTFLAAHWGAIAAADFENHPFAMATLVRLGSGRFLHLPSIDLLLETTVADLE